MGRLQQTVTAKTTTTETVKLRPSIERKLRTELRAYADLKAQKDAIELAMKAHGKNVTKIREDAGVSKLEFEGFVVTKVPSTYTKLDEKEFVALGGELSVLRQATKTLPKKPYDRITVPGAKEEGE